MMGMDWRKTCIISLLAAAGLVCGGCWDTSISFMPNPDPALRKSSDEFAAQAKKLYPFNTKAIDAGQAIAGAQVSYPLHRLELINLSDETWNNTEVWVNHQFVVFLPKIQPKVLIRIPFTALYNDHSRYFRQDADVMIDSLILIRGDKQFSVPVELAD